MATTQTQPGASSVPGVGETGTGPASSGMSERSSTQSLGRAFFGSTEARPGIITTELWLTIMMTATVIIAGYADQDLPVRWAWALGVGLVAAYVISRGIAKAGSSEAFLARLGRSGGDGQS